MISGVNHCGARRDPALRKWIQFIPSLVSLRLNLSREACQSWFVPASVNIFILLSSCARFPALTALQIDNGSVSAGEGTLGNLE